MNNVLDLSDGWKMWWDEGSKLLSRASISLADVLSLSNVRCAAVR